MSLFKNSKFYSKMKTSDFSFEIKKGDTLCLSINPDVSTTLYNAHKVVDIEKDGTIRIECINKCPEIECTFVDLYEFEIPKAKIDNSIKQSGRLGGITM